MNRRIPHNSVEQKVLAVWPDPIQGLCNRVNTFATSIVAASALGIKQVICINELGSSSPDKWLSLFETPVLAPGSKVRGLEVLDAGADADGITEMLGESKTLRPVITQFVECRHGVPELETLLRTIEDEHEIEVPAVDDWRAVFSRLCTPLPQHFETARNWWQERNPYGLIQCLVHCRQGDLLPHVNTGKFDSLGRPLNESHLEDLYARVLEKLEGDRLVMVLSDTLAMRQKFRLLFSKWVSRGRLIFTSVADDSFDENKQRQVSNIDFIGEVASARYCSELVLYQFSSVKDVLMVAADGRKPGPSIEYWGPQIDTFPPNKFRPWLEQIRAVADLLFGRGVVL